ncbi:dihydrofolate reductase family protein [Gryllotalpicola daejeonensis]|uniref:Dihydrofolate reductase family protein n=1 Tax=Gryllotalpicola daejeonensis TaxID=993087 RepID=A0ABP7ZDT0_9MICO
MGEIHIDLFTTVDLVAQAPGGPEEDDEGGFPWGGWQAPLIDEVVGQWVGAGMETLDALLLGRKTYDIFAAYWPHQSDQIGTLFNRIPKYVASRGAPALEWSGTTQLGTDLAAEVAQLRERHASTHVIGSLDFVQTLLRERLFDFLNLWVHPIILGTGKKVFESGAVPASLALVEPAATSPNGVVQLRYRLTDRDVTTGDMAAVVQEG